MPKVKTNSSAKKSFKITSSGHIKRKHAYKSHILTKKSNKRKHRLSGITLVHKFDKKNVKFMLRIGK
ncbi:MAG: 50S ribosomal protein L35 [Bacteroides sp.]|nr:MAG: 50S ribosomal protein L35 [Bacteroides sp.]